MTKLDTIDLNAFEFYANTIQKQHNQMLLDRKTYIIGMYEILRNNGYTRTGAINSIYTTLADKLNSMIEVRKGFIENVTKGIK